MSQRGSVGPLVCHDCDPVRVGSFVLSLTTLSKGGYVLIVTGRNRRGRKEWRVHTQHGGRALCNAAERLGDALERAYIEVRDLEVQHMSGQSPTKESA